MFSVNNLLRLTTRNRKFFNYCIIIALVTIFILFNISVFFKSDNNSVIEAVSNGKPNTSSSSLSYSSSNNNNNNNGNNNGNYNNAGSSSGSYSDIDPGYTDDDLPEVMDNTHTIFDTYTHKQYLTDLFSELISVKPDFPGLPSEYPKAPSMAPWDEHPVLSMKFLSEQYLTVTQDQVDNLKEKHKLFLDKVLDKSSKVYFDNNKALQSGHKESKKSKSKTNDNSDNDQSQFYIENSNGIVYVGGGKYSWFALLSIKHLRNIGSKLPVEVYIPFEDEYEKEFCEVTLPKLNAKCLKMYEILDLEVIKKSNFEIKGFMLKSLAILLSNFENILLLDADNVPYLNPDILFVTEPFLSYGLVVWPDYWERTTHPAFYEIQGIDLFEENLNKKDPKTKKIKYTSKDQIKNDVPLHDLEKTIPNPSTESGQLLISKKTHSDVILLSLYYNIYGPNYYYHLLTQWAPGQGDKDTFLAAANLLNSKYYQIKTSVKAIGYHHVKNDEFRGTAQGQYSPIDEYNFHLYHDRLLDLYEADFCLQKGITRDQLKESKVYQEELEEYKKIKEETYKQFTKESNPDQALKEFYADVFDLKIKLMFVHESTPKFDPIDLILNDQMKEDNQRIRFYDNVITEPGYYKFEKMQWESIYTILCSEDKSKLVHMKFIEDQIKHFGDKYNEESFCKHIKEEIDWIDSK